MAVLVTGGAGYIGAHIVHTLAAAGHGVVVVDDLSTGRASRIGPTPLVRLDLSAPDSAGTLQRVLAEHGVTGIVHLAAKKQVGESVARPGWYKEQNVGGLENLLAAARAHGVDRFVFSSSAAVYGEPESGVVLEDSPTRPINPYGETKLTGEELIREAGSRGDLRQVSLRYFNVAGAGDVELGDQAVLNLVTMVFDRLDAGQRPRLFGDDYPTPDGTCIRDYVHVQDLAEAHVAALDYLDREDRPFDVFNVGTGRGSSVREVLDAIAAASGIDTTPEVTPRRPGDPAQLVASVDRIASVLGWAARFGLAETVESAWHAWRHDRSLGLEPVRAAS